MAKVCHFLPLVDFPHIELKEDARGSLLTINGISGATEYASAIQSNRR
jgi:hypothetical protein